MSSWAQSSDANGRPLTLPGNPDWTFAHVVMSPTKGFDILKSPTTGKRLFVRRAHMYNAAAGAMCGLGPILALAKWGGGQIDASGVYTDDTTDLQDVGANDFPTCTLSTDNSGFIIGATEKWNVSQLVVGTAHAGGAPAYEFTYWNGSAWTALAAYIVDTPSFAGAATVYFSFFPPGDWVIGGTPVATVPTTRYNIRVRATTAPTATVALIGQAKVARIEDLRQVAATTGVDFMTLGSEPVIVSSGDSLTAYWQTANAAYFVSFAGQENA